MRLIIGFVLYFVIVFIVAGVVTFLYSLIIHGQGIIDWQTAFIFAIIFGLVFSWMNVKQRKRKK